MQYPRKYTISTMFFVYALAGATSGCSAFDQYYKVQGEMNQQVRLLRDTPEVRKLIAEAAAREEPLRQLIAQDKTREQEADRVKDEYDHPEKYTAGRKEFLEAMEHQASVLVHGQARSDTYEQSMARCTMSVLQERYFIKIRVTDGPDRGVEGWICSDKLDLYTPF